MARGQADMVDEAKLCSPICSALAALVVLRMASDGAETRALSAEQSRLPPLRVSGHPLDFLSRLLRGNVFTGIQKAGVDGIGIRAANSDGNCLLVRVGLFGGSSRSNR